MVKKKASPKQIKQRNKFKRVAKKCKIESKKCRREIKKCKGKDYKSCMKKELKK